PHRRALARPCLHGLPRAPPAFALLPYTTLFRSNAQGARHPEMHQTKKGNNYFFGMKAHIGVDLHTGLVHSMVGTAANVADVTQVDGLLHGEEELVLGDAGYQGVGKREEHQGRDVQWHIALRPSLRKRLSKTVQSLQDAYE